jgi:HAD superfamily hydrolase (TIGR01509 family)
MIETIIFDLGGVIVPFDFRRSYAALEGRSPYRAEEIPKRIATTDLVTRFETGRIEPEDFVRQLTALLEVELTYEEFRELWSCIFLPHTLIPESLLAALRARYRLLLLSNTNAIHFEMLRERYPLLDHFESYVLSYEVGALKPSPLIYTEALARAGCSAERCFFTDDIPAYVEGARRLGIDAVQFHDAEQLQREMRDRGIEW